MKRLLIFLVLIITAWSCGGFEEDRNTDPEESYYYSGNMQKIPLTVCPDEYFIIVKAVFYDDVLSYLDSKKFSVTSDVTEWGFYTKDPEYIIPESLADCLCFSIKGSGNVKGIPGLVYDAKLYMTSDGSLVGKSNLLWVEYDSDNEIEQIVRLKELAKKLNIAVLGKATTYGYWYALACTNKSSYNCLEISNYFVEFTDFFAQPVFGEPVVEI